MLDFATLEEFKVQVGKSVLVHICQVMDTPEDDTRRLVRRSTNDGNIEAANRLLRDRSRQVALQALAVVARRALPAFRAGDMNEGILSIMSEVASAQTTLAPLRRNAPHYPFGVLGEIVKTNDADAAVRALEILLQYCEGM